MDQIFDIALNISNPLSLAGLIAATLFYSIKVILSKNIFPTLTKNFTSKIFTLIINRMFILSLVATILGVSGFVIITIFGNSRPVDHEEDPLSLAIYVHGPEGVKDIILEHKGNLTAHFGNENYFRKSTIGENGRIFFDEIPIRFKGKEVGIYVEAGGFELSKPDTIYNLDGKPIYVAVRKKPIPKNTYVIEGPIPKHSLVELTDYLSENGFKYNKEQPFFKIRISYDTALIRVSSGLFQAGEKVIWLAINDDCDKNLGHTPRHAFPSTKTKLFQSLRKQVADSINVKKYLVLNQIKGCL